MGYQLAARTTLIAKLTPYDRLTLVGMALSARDRASETEPANVYYRGQSWLAVWHGRDEHDPAAHRQIRRSVTALVAAGYIERLPDRHGRKAVYLLHIPPSGPDK